MSRFLKILYFENIEQFPDIELEEQEEIKEIQKLNLERKERLKEIILSIAPKILSWRQYQIITLILKKNVKPTYVYKYFQSIFGKPMKRQTGYMHYHRAILKLKKFFNSENIQNINEFLGNSNSIKKRKFTEQGIKNWKKRWKDGKLKLY